MPTPQPEAHELDPGPIVSGKESSAEKKYIIVNCGDDEQKAYDTLTASAPAEYTHPDGATLQLSEATLDEYKGNGIWFGSAKYSSDTGADGPQEGGTGTTPENLPPPPAADQPFGGISFTTLGGTLHVTQSLATIQSVAAAGGAVPDTKRAIGVHGDSDQIDGTDITVPKLEITLKKKFAFVTLAYMQVLRDLTGSVADAKFARFEHGEVLFMGATGDDQGQGAEVSFTFAISKNEANVDVGNGMTITAKKGWEYIWASYSPAVNNNALTRQPIYAFLEKVYREEDFRKLGIFAND